MTNYIAAEVKVQPPEYSEIIIAYMSEAGFESFDENEDGFVAYITGKDFDPEALEEALKASPLGVSVDYKITTVERQNWNELWESNFSPVQVSDQCYIRAPFHPEAKGMKYEIVIEPKMSFGTGHHQTTQLMALEILKTGVTGKIVLDMGCGTGVLGILAAMAGAARVTAIDNDPWAAENTESNALANGIAGMRILQGDANILGDETYDVVLANINRNILLSDIPAYCKFMNKNACLIVSGFYLADLEPVSACSAQCGLNFLRYQSMDSWCVAVYQK